MDTSKGQFSARDVSPIDHRRRQNESHLSLYQSQIKHQQQKESIMESNVAKRKQYSEMIR